MSFADDHVAAYEALRDAGAVAVTFTRTSPGTHAPATDTFTTPTVSTVAGLALEVPGDPQRYRDASLVLATMPTLLFCPDTYGSAPQPGDAVTWTATVYAVKDVARRAPTGSGILFRVIVGA